MKDKDILQILYWDLGDVAGDMIAYKKELESITTFHPDYVNYVSNYNEACAKKIYIEKLIDKIEGE